MSFPFTPIKNRVVLQEDPVPEEGSTPSGIIFTVKEDAERIHLGTVLAVSEYRDLYDRVMEPPVAVGDRVMFDSKHPGDEDLGEHLGPDWEGKRVVRMLALLAIIQ